MSAETAADTYLLSDGSLFLFQGHQGMIFDQRSLKGGGRGVPTPLRHAFYLLLLGIQLLFHLDL